MGGQSSVERDGTDPMRLAYHAVLGGWLLLPLLWWGTLAQDGLSPYVAARILDEHPGEVYIDEDGGLFEPSAAFLEEGCRFHASAQDCDQLLVAFVSPPIALPLVAPLGVASEPLAMFLLRLLAAACLAGGMALVWRRLHGVSVRAPMLLVVTALAATPLATTAINHGQTSPLLFACALAGMGLGAHDETRRTVASVAVWAAAVAFKAFPMALLAVAVVGRRWRFLTMGAGALAALALLALLLGPASLWGDFVVASRTIGEQTAQNPYNGSLEAVVYQVTGSELDTFSPLLLGLRALLVAAACAVVLRMPTDAERWAFTSLVLVVLMPQTWWHYAWVALAALAVALWHRADAERWLWLLPAFVLLAAPLGVANSRGSAVPVAQLALEMAVVTTLAVLAVRAPAPRTLAP